MRTDAREANTTLTLPTRPPVSGYTTERALGDLTFVDPVAVVTPPGETNRLFVVEQRGRIAVVTNLAVPTYSTFLDISGRIVAGGEQGLLGLAFHPQYATNGRFYVFYTLNTTSPAGTGLHDRVSGFRTAPDDPNRADPASEVVLINQRDEAPNHNGGDLHFGPDGYLYIALGDEGGANDNYGNSQRIDRDFFAGILRIDVDLKPGSIPPNPHPAVTPDNAPAPYAVPPDNPFVGATSFNGVALNPTSVRTEFWAVGLRNPWRMAFDRETGLLYAADVGQNRLEEVNVITRGGNYGWNYREGTAAGPRGNPPAGVDFVPPILEYAHGSATNQGNSITGGVVYRGHRLSSLYGKYLFADYVSGHLWAASYQGSDRTPFEWLTTDTGIAGFGIDPRNGDILLADQNQDTIKRLVVAGTPSGPPLPPTLADTGAFADLVALRPNAGLVPYDLNVPFWSDGATKRRWFSVPDRDRTITFQPDTPWLFPTGTVWVKHFDLELTNGVPESARRLETRFLVRNPDGVYGITYRWDESQTNAILVPEQGLDESFVISDAGRLRTQVWHYPGRAECLACHTAPAGWALGFNTAQLNRPTDPRGAVSNQLTALAADGYFDVPLPDPRTLPALAHATNQEFSVSHRVRSYLAANCASCHQPSAGALGFWDARFTTPLDQGGIINGPLSDTRNHPANRVITPGSTDLSEMLARIRQRGPGQMPPIASNEVDQEAVGLLTQWVSQSLPGYTPPLRGFKEWQREYFGSATAPEAAPGFDADADNLANYAEYLLDRSPIDGTDRWPVSIERLGTTTRLTFPQVQNHGHELRLESAPAPGGPWRPVDAGSPPPWFGDMGQGVIEERGSDDEVRFYRVTLLPP